MMSGCEELSALQHVIIIYINRDVIGHCSEDSALYGFDCTSLIQLKLKLGSQSLPLADIL